MKPRDIFDIIARTVGLVVALLGFANLLYGVLSVIGVVESKLGHYSGITGVVDTIVGLLMMRGMIPVADIAFPPESPHVERESTPTETTQQNAKDDIHGA